MLEIFLWWKLGFSVWVLRAVAGSEWCFWGCWLRLCGALLHGLWCASMLVVVRIRYVGRLGAERLCERRRKLEEINVFFYQVADCVRVSVDVVLVTLTCAVLMGLRAGLDSCT